MIMTHTCLISYHVDHSTIFIYWFVVAVALSSSLNIPAGDAYTFSVKHNPPDTTGGDRYANKIGDGYSLQIVQGYATVVPRLLGFTADNGGKPVDEITLIIEQDMEDGRWTSITGGSHIHINARHIQDYDGTSFKYELEGMICHCMTRVLQWDGNGEAPYGLLTGIADFVRSRVGRRATNWSLVGQGDRWDQGYEVTAHFLLYCDDVFPGLFVAELNRKMKDGYDDIFFQDLTGKSVDVLWSDYKSLYGGFPGPETSPFHN